MIEYCSLMIRGLNNIYFFNLNDCTGKLHFIYLSRPTQIRISNQAKNIPVGLPSSPIKILGKSFQGFPSYDQTNKKEQTD